MSEKEQELFADRLSKLKNLADLGVDAYPATSFRTHTVSQVLADFQKLELAKTEVVAAGRVRALRGHGKIIFGNIEDGSGAIQFAVKADDVSLQDWQILAKLDVGDFTEFSGSLFVTQKGERTLQVKSLRLLTKALRALPEKYHGLKDTETRLRKRYLDLIANKEVRDLFQKKSIFWRTVREFFSTQDFLEVQTPVLEAVPGGADAEPFVTHHNALDRDFYLRISLELPLKRLLVGGFEKVFEIGRLFRNEGIDREHLQEYDDMEFYWAYADHEAGMKLVEELFKKLAISVAGKSETSYQGQILDWSGKWPKVDYFEIFKKQTGLDLNSDITKEELMEYAKKYDITYEKKYSLGRMIDTIYKRQVRPQLVNPCFLTGHPLAISPLAKLDPENPKKVLRFQILAGGTELGNGWAELNDPVDQRRRFTEQMKLRAEGDKEAQMMDEDFVEALEYGMPPAVGFGMSERVFAVLVDKPMRETVIFPPMKEEK